MKNFDEAAEREAFDRWHEIQRSSCPPSRAVLAEDAWLAAKREAAEQQAQALASYNEEAEGFIAELKQARADFVRELLKYNVHENIALCTEADTILIMLDQVPNMLARAQQGAPKPTNPNT